MGVWRVFVKDSDFSDYAYTAVIKGKNSGKQYIKDPLWATKATVQLFENKTIRHELENDYLFQTPISYYI